MRSIIFHMEGEVGENASRGGDSSSDIDEQFMQLLRNMVQERALRMLEELREFERRCCIGSTTSFLCQVVGLALVTFASFILSHEPPTSSP